MGDAAAALTIADLVEVADVETVVRLDGRPGWLRELVLTADVVQALEAVLGAREDGGGYFLVGHFGSGKSHLLAALAELAGAADSAPLGTWPPGLRYSATAVMDRVLGVAVPLVEHRAGAPLEDLVLGRAWRALDRDSPPAGTDRRAAWDALLAAAVGTGGRSGLVVLLDELSEFLRAKQGPALTEDLRFLQFLGEWARGRPVVVVAALQESIEEVANVSQRELTRIRDRYRTLSLTMRHVEDLVRGRLVRLRPGAEGRVEQIHTELDAAFGGWGVSRERLVGCYPLHPATLTVLEGLRFVFSQKRGVVDFICRQLRGDPAAGLPPWQERGCLDLLTPDRVYDHFAARLHERVETRRLAESVVPYFERAVDELFETDADRQLALRVVKLLCLLAASPVERPRTAAELAHMLLARVSSLDAAANVGYLEQAVLAPLAGRGAYVVASGSPPTYTVELEADAAAVAGARITQARAELVPGDRRAVRTLLELGSSPSLPWQLLADVGVARREFLWQNTLRSLLVGLVRVPELDGDDAATLVAQARSAGASGCLLVAEPEPDDPDVAVRAKSAASERLAVWVPAPFTPDELETILELHSRRLVLDRARSEGRTEPGGLVEFLERAASADAARARELLHRAYFAGTVAYVPGGGDADLPSLAGLPFERQLVPLASPLLNRLHPRHRDIAPRGELVGERLLRQLVLEVLAQSRISAGVADRRQLRSLVSGYLMPLGLMRRRGDAFVLAPDPARSAAVAEALRLVPGEPVPTADVVRRLADGPVGLTEPEALIVLNGCVQAGLLEAWRGRRRIDEPFLAITPTDRLSAGELLEPAARSALAGLGFAVGPGPFEPWNASVQRALWERARAWLEARREDVAQVHAAITALADTPVLGSVGTDPVAQDVARVGQVIDGCDPGLAPVPGLRRLVASIGDAEEVAGSGRRLAAVARFVREELPGVEQSVAYLTDPGFEIPTDQPRLAVLRDEALALARDILGLAADDRAGELGAVERELRRAYLEAYADAHDRFHRSEDRARVDAVRKSASYQALAALASVGAVAVPDDLVKVERALTVAAPPPCTRRLDLELAWKPRCGCGFVLGQEPPVADVDALTTMVDRGVSQHLSELGRPEHRTRLERAVEDLAGLGRDELAADVRSLLTVIAAAGAADPLTIAHLVTEPLASVVHDVLCGGRLVVQRDLAALREDVIGRRYPKRRLLELLAAWVDPHDEMPPGGFVEVVDSGESARPAGSPPAPQGATAELLAGRFPRLASLLPADRPADAFWLAVWWSGRADPPAWLPAPLLDDTKLLAAAAEAARQDLGARAELADLDARISAETLLGDQVAAALGLGARTGVEVASELGDERWLRHPLRLAAYELAGRLAGDWQLADRLPQLDLAHLAAAHAVAAEAELAPLAHLLAAARHLAALERRLGGLSCRELVEDAYPSLMAPVPELLSRAELAAVGGGLVSADAVSAVTASARRLLGTADGVLREHADAGFPGCLRIWEVGNGVVAPLLRVHDRVAVLLVDAMRADLWRRVRDALAAALPGRARRESWAVVPAPTRTTEAVAALYLGRPVPAGSGPASPGDLGDLGVPFSHLGVESTAVVGADREGSAGAVRDLWSAGPRLSVAVAAGVDEKLHRSSIELAGLLDEAAAALERRLLPTLAALPAEVPLVVLADHGFRENASWGHGPGSRYAHGGVSLEECVVPVTVLAPAEAGGTGAGTPAREPSPRSRSWPL